VETAEDAGSLETLFETLAQERAAAIMVKQNRPILVVLGNPPYNAFAGVSPQSEGGLVEPYKAGLQDKWHVRKFNLDDLYVRFYRIAERRIAERTGQGIICFISNYSWLSFSSFVVMRESLTRNFDRAWIENMHGNRTITEYGPDGRSSETIFAIRGFSVGIQQGVAIALLARTGTGKAPAYFFRDDIDASDAAERRAQLLQTLDDPEFESRYTPLQPTEVSRFLLMPALTPERYREWAGVTEISRASDWSGVLEMRKGALLAFDEETIRERMRSYCNPKKSITDLRQTGTGPVFDAARFDSARARTGLLHAGGLNAGTFKQLMLYPFDERWCFHSNVRPLWNEPRPELAAQQAAGNLFLVTRTRARHPDEGFPCFPTTMLPGYHLLDPNSHPFPFVLHVAGNEGEGLALGGVIAPNLSDVALRYCAALELPGNAETSRIVWHHALAIAYSAAWLAENGDGIRQGWPRVPLPDSADLLRASAEIGERVAALLDPQTGCRVSRRGRRARNSPP
jgi:Type ISP C-terminal specificity domain